MNCPECKRKMIEVYAGLQESETFYYVLFNCTKIGCHLDTIRLTYWREDLSDT